MKVLAVSAHPDDETLGAGGTLLKHLADGDEVFWLIATAPDPNDWPSDLVRQCLAQVRDVAAAYGFTDVFELNQPAARLEQIAKRELIERFSSALESIRPDRVYTVGDTDAHSDHTITYETLMSALKPFRREFDVKGIYAYEVLSSTDAAFGWQRHTFAPNAFADITQHLERKLDIMELYENQLQPDPFPRSRESIRALARYRGATVAVQYAEAFHVVRELLHRH